MLKALQKSSMSLDVLQVRDKRVPVLNITHQLSPVKHATKLN